MHMIYLCIDVEIALVADMIFQYSASGGYQGMVRPPKVRLCSLDPIDNSSIESHQYDNHDNVWQCMMIYYDI